MRKHDLFRSIKFVLSNKNIDQFNLRSIKRLFRRGAQCINLSPRYNTLNTVIFLSGQYIELFNDTETKLIAEENAIKVIDIVISNGARGIDDIYNQEANTLSIAMKCANINILKFLIDANANLNLNLKPYNHNDCSQKYPSDCYTLECALSASHKTGNPEFFRIALSNGAVPYHYSNIAQQIFVSQLVSIVDCVVFGGDNLMHTFSWYFCNFVMNRMHGDITVEKTLEILEIIMCTRGIHALPHDCYHSSDEVKEFSLICSSILLYRTYMMYDKNSDKYKKTIELNNRLRSRIQWLLDIAMIYDKCNERKSIIENEIIALPITLIDIISEYEYTPRFKVIDLPNIES
jgi:hypothetical protein